MNDIVHKIVFCSYLLLRKQYAASLSVIDVAKIGDVEWKGFFKVEWYIVYIFGISIITLAIKYTNLLNHEICVQTRQKWLGV
jgi:hypothetical protein